ncbi:MAG: hypothetical protein Q7S13_05035 [Candidatus Omnitrophota bacterium]|jgi:hypothetical protein|nr:hypothetical protein [Candidatus Omnitrophota bacterium]
MNILLAIVIVAGCFAFMGIGLLLAKKSLKRGCSVDPDACACRKEGKDPASCDQETTANSPKTNPSI